MSRLTPARLISISFSTDGASEKFHNYKYISTKKINKLNPNKMKKLLLTLLLCISLHSLSARINLPIPIDDGAYKVVECLYTNNSISTFKTSERYIGDIVKINNKTIFVFDGEETIDITLTNLVSKQNDEFMNELSKLLLGHPSNTIKYKFNGYIGHYDDDFKRYKEVMHSRIEIWIRDEGNPSILFWNNKNFYELILEKL